MNLSFHESVFKKGVQGVNDLGLYAHGVEPSKTCSAFEASIMQ